MAIPYVHTYPIKLAKNVCADIRIFICMYVHVFPVSSSVTDVIATLNSPNENKILHSITVTCIIQHENAADLCEVRANTNGETLTGTSLLKALFVKLNTHAYVCYHPCIWVRTYIHMYMHK